MDIVITIHDSLASEQTIVHSAFLAGYLWSTPQIKAYITNPLHSLFCGALGGVVAVFGARFVSNLMPDELKWLISVTLLISAAHYAHKSLKNEI